MTISIVIADDHHIFRESLRILFENQPDLQIIGEAADGRQVIDLAARLHPQVVILDLSMPGVSGLEALRILKSRHPEIFVVVLSAHEEEAFVNEAFQGGAAAYVFKEQSAADLAQAVRAVVSGGQYLSPRPADRREAQGVTPLTLREQQVVSLTAQGLSNAEIGQRLNISARTVETHRAHLMLKLGLKTRQDLMRYAQERQLG